MRLSVAMLRVLEKVATRHKRKWNSDDRCKLDAVAKRREAAEGQLPRIMPDMGARVQTSPPVFDKLGKPARPRIIFATGGHVACNVAKQTAERGAGGPSSVSILASFGQEMVTKARDVWNSIKVQTQELIRHVVLPCGATQPPRSVPWRQHGETDDGGICRSQAVEKRNETGWSRGGAKLSDRLIDQMKQTCVPICSVADRGNPLIYRIHCGVVCSHDIFLPRGVVCPSA